MLPQYHTDTTWSETTECKCNFNKCKCKMCIVRVDGLMSSDHGSWLVARVNNDVTVRHRQVCTLYNVISLHDFRSNKQTWSTFNQWKQLSCWIWTKRNKNNNVSVGIWLHPRTLCKATGWFYRVGLCVIQSANKRKISGKRNSSVFCVFLTNYF